MQISFYGAADTVTGSRHLVRIGDQSILLDCGMFQGFKALRERNWQAPPRALLEADAVVLSHDRRLQMAVTTTLNINFLRKPGPADLIAEGRVLKLGRRLAVIEVTIYSAGDAEPVAHATGTYSLPPTKDGP